MAEAMVKDVCSICLEHFKQPKILDCQHSFCQGCLEGYVTRTSSNASNSHFQCPLCRVDHSLPEGGVKDLKSKPVGGVPPCQGLTEDCFTPCEFRCEDCDQFLCRDCRRSHDLLRISKNHVVVRWDDAGQRSEREHDDPKPVVDERDLCGCPRRKRAKFLCCDCKVPVCSKCCFAHHNGHHLDDLEDSGVRERMREEVSQLTERLREEIGRFEQFSDNLRRIETDPIGKVCDQIDEQVSKLCQKVTKVGEEVKEEVRRCWQQDTEGATHGNTYTDRLWKLREKMERDVEEMRASVKNSVLVLEEHQAAVPMVDRLEKLRQQVKTCQSTKMVIPDIPVLTLEPPQIDEDCLREHIGKIIGLATYYLSSDDVNDGTITRVMRCKKLTWGMDFVRPTFENQSGMSGMDFVRPTSKKQYPYPWLFAGTPSKLIPKPNNLFLKLRLLGSSDNDLKSCMAEYDIEIVNEKDGRKSIQFNRRARFVPGKPVRETLPVKLSHILDEKQGFVDGNGQLKVVLKIHEISYD